MPTPPTGERSVLRLKMGKQGRVIGVVEVRIEEADGDADVGHVGVELEEGVVVAGAGGEEGVFEFVGAGEFGDAVVAHGGE